MLDTTEQCEFICQFADVTVNVLDIGPKVRGFKPGRSDGFLRATKKNQLSTFGEIKLDTQCRKILRHVKEFYEYERNIS
jgi:hypothetical protein